MIHFIKQLSAFTLFLVILAVPMACDTIEPPFTEENTSLCGDDNQPVPIRKILVEDYTGQKCGNCPRAAEAMEELLHTYCDHIVPIAVHAGFFAEPSATGHYTSDFRTETGNELDVFFGNSNAGLPNGMVNRVSLSDNYILPLDAWTEAALLLVKKAPDAHIRLNNNYNATTRELSVSVSTAFLSEMNGTYHLSVYLTEDSIVGWQKDYSLDPQDIEGYVHRHMLRKSLNGTWGESILDGKAVVGQDIVKTYTLQLPEAYVDHHCEIVAFVFDATTKEVIQAESEPIAMK